MRQRWTISSTPLISLAGRKETDSSIDGGLCWECWWVSASSDLPFERKHAGNHLEQYDSEGIDIGADIDAPGVTRLLRGHVAPVPSRAPV